MSVEEAIGKHLDKNYPLWCSEGELGGDAPKYFEAMVNYFNKIYFIDEVEDIENDVLQIANEIDNAYKHYKKNYQKLRLEKMRAFFREEYRAELSSKKWSKEKTNEIFREFVKYDNPNIYVKIDYN